MSRTEPRETRRCTQSCVRAPNRSTKFVSPGSLRAILACAPDDSLAYRHPQLQALLDVEDRVNTSIERRHTGVGGLIGIGLNVGWKEIAQYSRGCGGCACMAGWKSGVSGIRE